MDGERYDEPGPLDFIARNAVFDTSGYFGSMVFTLKEDHVVFTWYSPRASILMAKKPKYFHLPCGNLFKMEYAYPKKAGKPLHGWGFFIGWKAFFFQYLSAAARPEYMGGERPEGIERMSDFDLAGLRFHHNSRIGNRCECDLREEHSDCMRILKRDRDEQIRRVPGV